MYIIGGYLKKRKLVPPKGEQTRPSKSMLRETLFNICAPYIEGALFLDLFAGSGAIGFEALSRGASHVYFIESHRHAIEAIQKNIQSLGVQGQTTLLQGDVFKVLSKVKLEPDIVFADPPYHLGNGISSLQKLLTLFENEKYLKPGTSLFLEMHEFDSTSFEDFKNLEIQKKRKMGESCLVELKVSNL